MRTLAVFARAPRPGRVKTRLSPALPAPLAATLYGAVLADTFATVLACPADRRVACWADDPSDVPDGIESATQHGDGLGERLQGAFETLDDRARGAVIVLGSDTPGLRASHLAEAFAALEHHDVVVGPTVDGGYWGLGLRGPAPSLFHDIPWSTREVLTRTLVRAHAAGLRVATVATLEDLDTPHDLALLVGSQAARHDAWGPRARAALAGMGLLPER